MPREEASLVATQADDLCRARYFFERWCALPGDEATYRLLAAEFGKVRAGAACPSPEQASTACRRCSDCEGENHHWIEEADEKTGWCGYLCKHCPARAEMCDDCDGVIEPGHRCDGSSDAWSVALDDQRDGFFACGPNRATRAAAEQDIPAESCPPQASTRSTLEAIHRQITGNKNAPAFVLGVVQAMVESALAEECPSQSKGHAPWLSVINREGAVEALPWADEASARNYFDTAQMQWSESWLCRVEVGPRDMSRMKHPASPATTSTTVYVVQRDYAYEGRTLMGVFSSEEKARAFAEDDRPKTNVEVVVTDWTLDGALRTSQASTRTIIGVDLASGPDETVTTKRRSAADVSSDDDAPTDEDRLRTWLNGADMTRISSVDWQRLLGVLVDVRAEERDAIVEWMLRTHSGGYGVFVTALRGIIKQIESGEHRTAPASTTTGKEPR